MPGEQGSVHSPPRLIAISGNIGAGKSTLTELLGEALGYQTLIEPADENPYIRKYYADPERWGFQSQMWFLLDKERALRAVARSGKPAVVDRTLDENLIMARQALGDGDLDLYRNWFEVVADRSMSPDVVLLIQIDPAHALERIKLRGRPYERTVSIDLLRRIDEDTREWIALLEVPVAVIAADELEGRTARGQAQLALDSIAVSGLTMLSK